MAGETLIDSLGRQRIAADGSVVGVPAGGIDALYDCCCDPDGPGGGTVCTCRRNYTGLNYIYQQDGITRAPVETLYSLMGPLYASAFSSSSNTLDASGGPGAHRCWETYLTPGGGVGGEPEGYDCESDPLLYERCMECPAATDPNNFAKVVARPCGWFMEGTPVCACIGAEAYAPQWVLVSRNPFTPIIINNCITSAIAAGTLGDETGGGDIPVGSDIVCDTDHVEGFCPWPGNQLRVTITIGGQSLQVFGWWFDNVLIKGVWFWHDGTPANTGSAWTLLPYHQTDHNFEFKLTCDNASDGHGTFSIQNIAGVPPGNSCPFNGYGWVDGSGTAYTHAAKTWAIPYTATTYTINDTIDPETALGGASDPPVDVEIVLQWITI